MGSYLCASWGLTQRGGLGEAGWGETKVQQLWRPNARWLSWWVSYPRWGKSVKRPRTLITVLLWAPRSQIFPSHWNGEPGKDWGSRLRIISLGEEVKSTGFWWLDGERGIYSEGFFSPASAALKVSAGGVHRAGEAWGSTSVQVPTSDGTVPSLPPRRSGQVSQEQRAVLAPQPGRAAPAPSLQRRRAPLL